ncbi:MAG: hypothetical protein UIM53_03880 [Acutalibacteraceae bacterium]|nr:hypothetical protein [Acutalibacteraceae bacterium]
MLKKIFLCIICMCLCACASSRHTEQSVLEHQKQIDRAEESIRTRDRAIDTCIRELACITGRSEEMGGDIEDIIRELDLYNAAVQRLLRAAGYAAGSKQTAEESSGGYD